MRRRFGAVVLAILLGSTGAWAGGAPIDKASKEQWKAAAKTFKVADDLYDAKKYEEAITAYRASYDIVASPNPRLMMARSMRELGRLGQAYLEMQGALADAEAAAAQDPKKYSETVRAARDELEALKARVALLSLEVKNAPPGTKLEVAGRAVDLESLEHPLALEPGAVVIVAQVPGKPDNRRELALEAGTSTSLHIDLTPGAPAEAPSVAPTKSELPPPEPVERKIEPSSSTRTWAYVAGGVGVAGLVTFGIFGALDNSKFSGLDSDCPDGHCPPDRQADIDAGRRYQTIANVGLVVGVIGVGAGAVLFLTSSSKEKRARRGTFVGVSTDGVRWGGSF